MHREKNHFVFNWLQLSEAVLLLVGESISIPELHHGTLTLNLVYTCILVLEDVYYNNRWRKVSTGLNTISTDD